MPPKSTKDLKPSASSSASSEIEDFTLAVSTEEVELLFSENEAKADKDDGAAGAISSAAFRKQIKELNKKTNEGAIEFLNKNYQEFIQKLSDGKSKLNLDLINLQEIAKLLTTIERDPSITIDDASKKLLTFLVLKQTFTRIMMTPHFNSGTDSLIALIPGTEKALPGGKSQIFAPEGKEWKSRVNFLEHYLKYIGHDNAASLLKEDCAISFPFSLATTSPTPTKSGDQLAIHSIEAKANPLVAILLRRNAREDLRGLFTVVSPYIDDNAAIAMITNPVQKTKDFTRYAKDAVKFITTYGVLNALESSAEKDRTLPRIVASDHYNISSDFVHFLLEKSIPSDNLHDAVMKHTFSKTNLLHSSERRVITVFALNCIENQQDFTDLYKKIHSKLTDKEKITLYLEIDPKKGVSFASIAAEQYPEIFKQILVDFTDLMNRKEVNVQNIKQLIESSNKSLAATSDRAKSSGRISAAISASASEERASLLPHSSSTETDEAPPQDDLTNTRYTEKNIRSLIYGMETKESKNFITALGQLTQPEEASPATVARRPIATQQQSKSQNKSSSVCNIM